MSQALTVSQKFEAGKKFFAFGLNEEGVNRAIEVMVETGYSAEKLMSILTVFGVNEQFLERGSGE